MWGQLSREDRFKGTYVQWGWVNFQWDLLGLMSKGGIYWGANAWEFPGRRSKGMNVQRQISRGCNV